MYNPDDDKKSSIAWTQTANMAKNNNSESYIAWIKAAEKAIKYKNPTLDDNKANYPRDNDIKKIVATLIYNDKDAANSEAEKLGLEIPEEIQKPGDKVIDAAISNRYAFNQRIENIVHRNHITQRRNAQIFADQDFAIFDMDENMHNEFNNMSENLNALINSLHQQFNNFFFGQTNNNNNGFVQREEARQSQNNLNQRGL